MRRNQGTLRPIAPLDLDRSPDLKPVVDAWYQEPIERLTDLENGPLASIASDLVVVESDGRGEFFYHHYGERVSQASGLDMQGKTTADFNSSVGDFFSYCYRETLLQKAPIYAVHKANKTHHTHSWERLLLPIPPGDGFKQPRVLAFVRPVALVADVLADFSRDIGFLGGTLEPVLDDGILVDFALLSLSDPVDVFGLQRMDRLTHLFGRPLTMEEIRAIQDTPDGITALSCEVPDSMDRFGRTFQLKVIGDANQPVFSLTDATEFIVARETADAHKEAMADFARTASDWMWESDTEHRMTMLSEAVEVATGHPSSHYVGKSRFAFANDPENATVFEAHRKQVDAHEPFRDLVYKIKGADGKDRWLRINGVPRFDQGGAFLGYRGTGSNITAEVEAKRALEERKAAMEDFANMASDWMWETDADNRFTKISGAIHLKSGFSPDHFIGKDPRDLDQLPENAGRFDDHRKDVEARRPFRDFVCCAYSSDGSLRWSRINGVPRFDKDGTFLGVTVLEYEVEARQAAEERKAAMEDFAKVASDWMWETDVNHAFTYMSTAIGDQTGADPDRYIGVNWFELENEPENAEVFAEMRRAFEAHEPFANQIYKSFREDGTIMWVRASGKPRFSDSGAFLGYRGTSSNITAEVEARRTADEQKAAMEDFAETASDWMWEVDADHIITMMSPAIENFTGKTPASYVGTSRFDLFVAPDNAETLEDHKADIAARKPFSNFVYQLHLDDGRVMWARANGKPRFTEDGTFLGYRGTGTNITEEIEAREQAARRAQELADAHRVGRLGAWSFNRRTKMVTLSPEYLELVGLPAKHATMPLDEAMRFFAPDSRIAVSRSFRKVLRAGGEDTIDVVWTSPCCSMDLNVIARARSDAKGRVYEVYGTVQDITERKQAERALESLAFHDPLTGLGNRSYFARELNAAMEHAANAGQNAGLLLLDLDHFKEVNDSLGHAAGDELLRRVAERLSMTVTGRGTVFRLGGDEFAAIVPNARSAAELGALAATIISAFAGTVKLNDGAVHISTSIGMAMLPAQTSDPDEGMRYADLALYEAKNAGRNRALLFHAGLDRDVQDRVNLARDLREAIKDDGLDAHYQLQVDVVAGKVQGFEALARWNHPTRGPIPPSTFIPIAESSRLIADLGSWMVRTVCRQGRAWLDAGGAPLEMAVNLSVAQLWHRDVESDITSALEETGFPPELLCVELTETVFGDEAMPRIQRLFAALKRLGVKIALDDFGTGYSSLQYLNDLSFDKVKIDRSFISNCDQHPDKMRLLQGIIGLGKGLGLGIIVEGVENESELQVTSDLGCEVVQGFFFAKPKPFHEACLDAAQIEADYGFNPVFWKQRGSEGMGSSAEKRRA
ncbi:MAG: EAL domain-containing protein [Hyphomicrobiales bacterium]